MKLIEVKPHHFVNPEFVTRISPHTEMGKYFHFEGMDSIEFPDTHWVEVYVANKTDPICVSVSSPEEAVSKVSELVALLQ